MTRHADLLDDTQRTLSEKFGPRNWLHSQDHVNSLIDWVTYWLRNPGRFAETYFNIRLYLYQHIMLKLMMKYPTFVCVASRSDAKTFVIAVFACVCAILKPGSRVVVASATKGQARLIVSEKIRKILLPRSPLLNAEIDKFNDSTNKIEVLFKNGSSIIVVAASDTARGHRSTFLIFEEFRMIDKNVVDSILRPFLEVRKAGFQEKPEYAGRPELIEEPKSAYISSAWYKSHWMWQTVKKAAHDMLTTGEACVLGMDYSIALKHNIKTRKVLQSDREAFDPISWAIEYENQMISENTRAYFTYDMLDRNRVLRRPFYPRKDEDVFNRVKNPYAIPKQKGELRIVSCDIATEGGAKNDNSIFSCIRLLPESVEYKQTDKDGEHVSMKRGYRRQVVYLEAQSEFETVKQSIRIKQLFYDFDADYCVLDTRNAGISIYDTLAKVLYDDARNVEYEPWSCMNDDRMRQNRIVIPGQKECIFSIKASLELNSNIAVAMRTALNDRMIDLLISREDAEDDLRRIAPGFDSGTVEEQIWFERPYIETAALINEMISLEYQLMKQSGLIKIEERSTARKDRYTSVSYGNYFASLLEKDLFNDTSEYDYCVFVN